jgi:excisionase family DNA binding protein
MKAVLLNSERGRAADTPTKLLLTPAQASVALAISPRKLWQLTASGEIPHIRLGRCVRYPVDVLQRWIDDQTKGGSTR